MARVVACGEVSGGRGVVQDFERNATRTTLDGMWAKDFTTVRFRMELIEKRAKEAGKENSAWFWLIELGSKRIRFGLLS
ncbi:MAG: hypothetical protein Q4C95_12050 [Planctomycetia bacterium]|nr:hypothetical protein [Planctomycetia bacterium]